MHRVIAVSDSHGMAQRLESVLSGILAKQPVDVVVFLGDGLRDWENATGRLFPAFPKTKFYRVKGNNDRDMDAQDQIVFDVGGVRFLACHGHRYRVKVDLDLLEVEAASNDARVALYGHTHIPDITSYFSCLFVNPGAVNGWGSFSPVAAEILIHDDGTVTARHILENETKEPAP